MDEKAARDTAIASLRENLIVKLSGFVTRESVPAVLDQLRASIEEALEKYMEHPLPRAHELHTISRMEDEVLHIELRDECNRVVGREEPSGDLVAFNDDGTEAWRYPPVRIRTEESDAG